MSKAGDLILMMYNSECMLRRIPKLVEAVLLNASQGKLAAASEIAGQVTKDITGIADALREYNEKFVAERDKRSGGFPATSTSPLRSRSS